MKKSPMMSFCCSGSAFFHLSDWPPQQHCALLLLRAHSSAEHWQQWVKQKFFNEPLLTTQNNVHTENIYTSKTSNMRKTSEWRECSNSSPIAVRSIITHYCPPSFQCALGNFLLIFIELHAKVKTTDYWDIY